MQRIGALATGLVKVVGLVGVVGCGSPSAAPGLLGEPPSEWIEPIHTTVRHVGAWDLELDPVLGTVRTMTGAGIAFGAGDPELASLAFVQSHADLLGTTELVVDGTMVDHGGPGLTSIALAQRHHGLPVIGGHLGLTISHGRLVLVQGVTYPVGEFETTPAITELEAISVGGSVLAAAHPGDHDTARLVVLPERGVGAVAYHLAWEVTAWRGDDHAVVNVDATSGTLLGGYDANRYDYAGRATNLVDARTVGDEIVQMPAAYLRLHANRGAVTTDGEGAFAIRGAAGPLMVTANLQGAYISVHNAGGPEAHFIGMMRPESPYALEWTEARSTPEERDVFRAANTTNRFVATVFPDLPWIAGPLPANVNLPRTCNAFWNGTSINFFVEGNGCNNSGRIFDVVAHEWGHGLDQNAPGAAIDGALGEFIGDLVSFVQTDSPLIGPNFLTNGGAVRDLEDPAFECFDPSKRGVHAKGQLLGAVVWDIRADLLRAGFSGEPLKRLLLRPIAIAQTRAEWYRAMLAVDDDDGNLANGTPHECLIYAQFDAHSCGETRWPGIPDQAPPQCATPPSLK